VKLDHDAPNYSSVYLMDVTALIPTCLGLRLSVKEVIREFADRSAGMCMREESEWESEQTRGSLAVWYKQFTNAELSSVGYNSLGT
jgi:hypothetical protein